MKSLLAWLYNINPDADIGFRLNHPPQGWVVFLFVVGVLGFTIWIYRNDGKRTASPVFRFILGTLRVILLAIALLLLTEPVLLATQTEVKPSTVLIMVDNSYSMSLGFPYAEQKIRDEICEALGDEYEVSIEDEEGAVTKIKVKDLKPDQFGKISRMQVVQQALKRSKLVAELQKRHGTIHTFSFSDALVTKTGDGKELDLEKDFAPTGQETRIGKALRMARKELRGQPIAGVIVIGDGRQNAGEDAVHVASSQFKPQRIPIYTVGIGDPGEPKDIELTFEAPEIILPDDPTEIIAYIRQKGYDQLQTITVQLYNDDGELVTSEEVKLGKSGEKLPVPLKFRKSKAGKYVYKLKIPKQPGELREDNNDGVYNFEVVDKKVKVLFVEGQDLPRWEYRYLKNALLRDHTTEADILLSTSDGSFIWDGTAGKDRLESFPVNKLEMNAYDVLILGDVNPVIFTKGQMNLIRDFVREGGGFILIAGERFAPSSYVSGPLADMLPVVPQQSSYEAPAGGFQEDWPLELTKEGDSMAWTHLDPDNLTNREIWENLPKLFWYYPVKRSKELAISIAVHPYDKDEKGEKMPLVVVMPYGSGKTMYIGSDDFWRWRKGVGDRYHYRFYNQAIRYLSVAKRLGGQKRFLLGSDKVAYSIGDRVILTALVKDERFNPLDKENITVYIKDSSGKSQTQVLSKKGDFPGNFEGYYYPNKKGSFTMWLMDDRQPDVRQSETTFKVDLPQLELENPRMNEELLRSIAASGGDGGSYFSINNISKIPAKIEPKEDKVLRETPITLWDNWVMMALFTMLITAEWLLRKRGKMI